jgi:hypothetical protein
MKRVIEIILMLCGVLFLIELGVLGWFYVTDPLGMFVDKPAVTQEQSAVVETEVEVETEVPAVEKSSAAPAPSAAQTEAAASLGVEIPTFTAKQITCFEQYFGAARVAEIKNGAVPTATELYQGRSCL